MELTYDQMQEAVSIIADRLHPELVRFSKFRGMQDKAVWEQPVVGVEVRLQLLENLLNPEGYAFGDTRRYQFHAVIHIAGCLKEIRLALDQIIEGLDLTDLAGNRPAVQWWEDREGPPPPVPAESVNELARVTENLAGLLEVPVAKMPELQVESPVLDNPGHGGAPLDAESPWYHTDREARPEKFAYGPLAGTAKDLQVWIGGESANNVRFLESKQANGEIWVVRKKRTLWKVWFSDQTAYTVTASKQQSAERKKSKR